MFSQLLFVANVLGAVACLVLGISAFNQAGSLPHLLPLSMLPIVVFLRWRGVLEDREMSLILVVGAGATVYFWCREEYWPIRPEWYDWIEIAIIPMVVIIGPTMVAASDRLFRRASSDERPSDWP